MNAPQKRARRARGGTALWLLPWVVGCGAAAPTATAPTATTPTATTHAFAAPRAAGAPPAVGRAAGVSARPALRLQRGINLGNALDAPTEGAWGVTLDASDFSAVRAAGFDHVRLPVKFSGHADAAAPYALAGDFLARVDWAVDQALTNGLAVVIDLHHYETLMQQPEAEHARFVSLWSQIADRERSRPADVMFELCNEPTGPMTADVWNGIMLDALAAVRRSNPTRVVVLEGVNWASARNLRDTLKVPGDDANLVGSFHMYQPMLFTHQGADYMPEDFATRGVVFPGPPTRPIDPLPQAKAHGWVADWFSRYNTSPAATNPSSPARVIDEFDIAQAFADRSHLPVYMGEFASIDNADAASRETWTRLVRKEAERRGFGWAYWDDGGSFKVYDRKTRTWNTSLKGALLD